MITETIKGRVMKCPECGATFINQENRYDKCPMCGNKDIVDVRELKEMENKTSKADSAVLPDGYSHSVKMTSFCVRRKSVRAAGDGENEHLAPIIEMGNRSCGDY